MSGTTAPSRAARNKNPGNLRPRRHEPVWPGQSGLDTSEPDPPYAQFVTNVDGFAALTLWLLDANIDRGLASVEAMINVFAPPSDDNPTSDYSASVEKHVGESVVTLMSDGKANIVVITKLMQAIAKWESPTQWAPTELAAGLQLGLLRWSSFRADVLRIS